MNGQVVHAGELNRMIGFYKKTSQKTATSSRVTTPELVTNVKSKRIDVDGDEEVQGKLISLKVCKYVVRKDQDLKENGDDYLILDDGQWFNVHSVVPYGQRDKFLLCKCSSKED